MQSEDYVVLECTSTMELVEWGGPTYGLWSPTEFVDRVEGRGQYAKKVKKRVCVMPGYAFVPYDQFFEMRRRAPDKFHVNALEYDVVGRPKSCTLSDLRKVEAILREEQRLPEAQELQRGDAVLVQGPLFNGFVGSVQCSGTHRIVRVLIGTKYVNLHKRLLKKL